MTRARGQKSKQIPPFCYCTVHFKKIPYLSVVAPSLLCLNVSLLRITECDVQDEESFDADRQRRRRLLQYNEGDRERIEDRPRAVHMHSDGCRDAGRTQNYSKFRSDVSLITPICQKNVNNFIYN